MSFFCVHERGLDQHAVQEDQSVLVYSCTVVLFSVFCHLLVRVSYCSLVHEGLLDFGLADGQLSCV